jgi:acyl-CoA thioesterase-2
MSEMNSAPAVVAPPVTPNPMMADPLDLISMLALEQLELNLFRGWGPRDDKHFFGGHVIAQALLAAYATIEGRVCHSLHGYFIRPGDTSIPVIYEVDRARDGGSFSTRRVIAIQHGQQIFNLAASFQTPEEGFEHQFDMPDHVDPESLEDEPRGARRPVDVRWPDPQPATGPVVKAPRKYVWMRAKRPIPPQLHLHQALLAYASDMAFMETALRPHGLIWTIPGLQTASLDHAMWFHHPFNFNDWHLYDQDSPATSGGRGLVRGEMFSRDGKLVASIAQDCLMRLKAPRG